MVSEIPHAPWELELGCSELVGGGLESLKTEAGRCLLSLGIEAMQLYVTNWACQYLLLVVKFLSLSIQHHYQHVKSCSRRQIPKLFHSKI